MGAETTRRTTILAATLGVLATGLAACTVFTAGPDGVLAVGVVEFVSVEGGCWTIRTDGTRYRPTDLPEAFREDGLRVLFEGEPRDDVASFCPGEPLDLRSIERVD